MKNISHHTALNITYNDDRRSCCTTRTYSGLTITLWPLEDEIGAISIRDIAHHLAKIVYYPESANAPFTAAQYAIELAASLKHAAPHVQLYGFLSNAHEAYLGHIPPAVREAEKLVTADQWGKDRRDVLESAFTVRIFNVLDLFNLHTAFENGPVATEALVTIRHAQHRLNSTLERDLGAYIFRHPYAEKVEPFSRAIAPLPWDCVADKYIRTYESLTAMAARTIPAN